MYNKYPTKYWIHCANPHKIKGHRNRWGLCVENKKRSVHCPSPASRSSPTFQPVISATQEIKTQGPRSQIMLLPIPRENIHQLFHSKIWAYTRRRLSFWINHIKIKWIKLHRVMVLKDHGPALWNYIHISWQAKRIILYFWGL